MFSRARLETDPPGNNPTCICSAGGNGGASCVVQDANCIGPEKLASLGCAVGFDIPHENLGVPDTLNGGERKQWGGGEVN